MKKVLFLLFTVLSFTVFSTKNIFAQTNTFKCRWDAPNIKCIVSDTVFGSSVDCKEGSVPDQTYCSNFKTGLSCDGAPAGSCVGQFDSKSGIPDEQNPTCSGGTGINTAIGCIPIGDPNAFVGFLLKWGIGVGAGIAFLLILFAGFQITTASGEPERLKAGQELMTSAIAGLVLIVFSVFILRIIGVDILGIPGLVN